MVYNNKRKLIAFIKEEIIMKLLKKVIACVTAGILALSMVACGSKDDSSKKAEGEGKVTYVASFYPMYILTLNLTKDIDNVNVSCMADMNFGCIHDYTMKTEDLKNIEKATAFIENGFNLEPFNDKIEKAYPKMKIIKASDGIDVKNYGYDEYNNEGEEEDEDEDGDDDACCGSDNGVNPHLWTDVNLYIEQVKNVAKQLKEVDPANAEKYNKNCDDYTAKLTQIKNDVDAAKAQLKDKKVLVMDETLPNLCHSLDIKYLFIETDHEQEALSAEQLKKYIADMKKDNMTAILIAKGSDDKAAKMIADESNATVYELNTCMTGSKDIDEYIKDMKANLETLSKIK